MSIIKRSKQEEAVSPVVGVMLMLVVTIIIAAVVATFASGVITNTEPAPVSMLSLESYSMGTVNQAASDPESTYKDGWYDYGVTDYGEWGVFSNSNYAPYTMVFKHNGGDSLYIDGLKMIITYNAASYTTPLKEVTSAKEWKVGDSIILQSPFEAVNGHNYQYGLSQQNMGPGAGPSYYEWQLLDANNYVLAKGTESTKLFEYGMTATFNVTSLVKDEPKHALLTVNAPTYPNGEDVKITGTNMTFDPSVSGATISDGTYSWVGTVTGNTVGSETVTVEVGMFKETFVVTVAAAP